MASFPGHPEYAVTQRGYTNLGFNEATDDMVAVASVGPCANQTDNHASISSLNFFTGRMFFLMPNQQCQST